MLGMPASTSGESRADVAPFIKAAARTPRKWTNRRPGQPASAAPCQAPIVGQQDAVVASHAEQAESHDQHAGGILRGERDLKRGIDAVVGGFGGRVGAPETFMPMKPVNPDSTAPIRKPIAEYQSSPKPSTTNRTAPTWRWSCTAGCRNRPAPYGRGDFLHARIAGGLAENPLDGNRPVGNPDDRADKREDRS